MVQAQVLDLLSSLVADLGLGVVFISHDLSVLAATCDRVAEIMYAGRIVEQGRASDVFTKPLHPYARALAAAFPGIGDARFRYAPAGVPGDPARIPPGDLPSGCPFHPRCPRARERLAARLSPCSRNMASGTPRLPSRRGASCNLTATSEAGTTVLETRGLGVEFGIRGGGAARAVDGVDLAVRRGEIIALVGESGSREDDIGAHDSRSATADLRRRLRGGRAAVLPRLPDPAKACPQAGAASSCRTRRVRSTHGTPCTKRWPRASRVHGLHDGEEAKVADALSRAGLRPPERFYLRYPHEAAPAGQASSGW